MTQRLAERYGEAWNAHDLDAVMALHTDDTVFRLHLLDAPELTGRAAVREAFAAPLPFGAALAHPTGTPVRFTGVDVIAVSGALVHRKETYLDSAGAAARLGLFDRVEAAAR